MEKRSLLIIMDGWGEGKGDKSDVIAQANTPFIDSLKGREDVGFSRIKACGNDVGLPEGQMGNSEVGHLNIGAGRVVYQDLVRINRSVKDNSIAENEILNEAIQTAIRNDKKVHFIGLISDGGVHAATPHLMKLIEVAEAAGLEKSFIHAITDGRDTDPRSGAGYIQEVEDFLSDKKTKIATVCGRFYAMDRDKRWDRVKRAYDLYTKGIGSTNTDPVKAIKNSYDNKITDEFIEPVAIIDDNNKELAKIESGDVIICFNFRTDRLRELTTVLTQQDMPEEGMNTIPLEYYTMTTYDDSFKNVKVIFDKLIVKNTLGEVIQNLGKKQIRIAETEKYPHVTFFFSGGREEEFENEKRILIPSPKEVATYDQKPSMSAPEVTESILPELEAKSADFICLNFANGDMVGHTGIYEAILEAVETVDGCVKRVTETALENGYSVLITADHGNADFAVNEDGSPNTAHSLNEVPLYLIDKDYTEVKDGKLADLAPTILKVMGIDIPEEMTGEVLV